MDRFNGNLIIAGKAFFDTLPLKNPLSLNGDLIAEMNSDASSLLFSSGSPAGLGEVALAPSGKIVVAGEVVNGDAPTTPGVFQTKIPPLTAAGIANGHLHGYIAVIDIATPAGSLCPNPIFLDFGTVAAGMGPSGIAGYATGRPSPRPARYSSTANSGTRSPQRRSSPEPKCASWRSMD